MSKVTSIIIAASAGENAETLIGQLKKFQVNGSDFKITSIDDRSLPQVWYGGNKFIEATLLLGAYNHLDLDGLIAFMRSEMVWSDPEDVQLIVKGEDDFKFRIVELFPE